MKLKDIIGTIGSVAGYIHPAIGAAITGVNKLIPYDEEKLPITATPEEIHAKIATLPPDVQAKAYEMDCDVRLAEITSEVDRYRILAQTDAQSTRPKIAKMMAWCIVGLIILFSCILVYAIHNKFDVAQWWPIFVGMIATPAGIVQNYFGNLRKEQGNRLNLPEKSLLEVIRGK